MKADAHDLWKVFGYDRTLVAPLFQRPYVWEQDKQWEPLWVDIKSVARKMLENDKNVAPHFLGAVVLDQRKVPVGKPDSRLIIDGQQRLTTIQIILAAFRDVCSKNIETAKLAKATEQLIFNNDPLVDNEEDKFKVWPTNVDRASYQMVMTERMPLKIQNYKKSLEGKYISRILDAYLYFFNVISEWINNAPEDRNKMLETLFHAIREKLRLVVIDMDKEDNAQVIFETLNARGTPLLPSDLVKNFLLRKAEEKSLNVESLYKQYWYPFEKDDAFWRKEIRQGRIKRPVIDLFLQHYLTLMKAHEVSTTELFFEFQQFVDENPKYDIEWHLRSFKEYSDIFFRFLNISQSNREGKFFYRLDIMDTTTVFPFLLGLYYELANNQYDKDERTGILEDLESYLVRRMICRLTGRQYNVVFFNLLDSLRQKGIYTRQLVRQFLAEQSAESNRWPDNAQFKKAWLQDPLYGVLTRPRVRIILEALDEGLNLPKNEKYELKSKLTVEHLMPQDWEEHWPIFKNGEKGNYENKSIQIEHRKNLIHTIGNLTLITKALNPSVSNTAFEKKKKEILKHSAINLNRFLYEADNWDEKTILNRGEILFETACKIWPHPGKV